MISCKLIGGLGNQMFQIATTKALALANNVGCCFGDSNTPNQGRNAFEYKYSVFLNTPFHPFIYKTLYREPTFTFSPIPFKDEMMLSGYFQSPKYFDTYKEDIQKLFLRQDKLTILKKKYRAKLKDSVSIHIRRGDYVDNPNLELLDDYYIKALDLILGHLKIKNILVFSDDIIWTKLYFSKKLSTYEAKKVHYIERLEDYEDMYLMSLCRHNIIANSSFSWWGSYLNKNPNKMVIAPMKWFKEGSGLSEVDIYTKEMIVI